MRTSHDIELDWWPRIIWAFSVLALTQRGLYPNIDPDKMTEVYYYICGENPRDPDFGPYYVHLGELVADFLEETI